MNTDDLRSLLTERAGETVASEPTSDARIAGVQQKTRAIRTRRMAGIGGAVAAVTAIVASGLLPLDLNADKPEPATWTDLELPEYFHGGVKIGEVRLDLPKKTTSVTVTPEAFPLILVTECDTPMKVEITAEDHDTDEHLVNGSPCGGDYESLSVIEEPVAGDEPAIGLGMPVTYRVTIEGAYDANAELDQLKGYPEDGAVAFGIYESVSWSEYSFPPPPDDLVEFDESVEAGPHEGGVVVKSSDDPNASVTVQFTGDGVDLDLRTQTPGRMKILINGEEVANAKFWDYTGRQFQYETGWKNPGPDVHYDELPEEGVGVTFVPRDFTGAWTATLIRCDVSDDSGGVGCGPLGPRLE